MTEAIQTYSVQPNQIQSRTSAPSERTRADFGTAEQFEMDFMKLLLTELQHQDPMNPLKDKDFIAQMAQIQSLKEMRTVSQTQIAQSAQELVGKKVTVFDSGLGVNYTGEVTEMRKAGSQTFIRVQNRLYPVKNVISVHAADPSSNTQKTESSDSSVLPKLSEWQFALSLLGKSVRVHDADQNSVFKGTVSAVTLKNGKPHIQVNNVSYSLESLQAVIEQEPSSPVQHIPANNAVSDNSLKGSK